MRQLELVYREVLYQAIEKKNRKLTQLELSRKLNISLSIVNKAIKNLSNIGSVEIHLKNFHVIDIKKILYYWASIRNLQRDIVYKTRVELPVIEIEKSMPNNIIFTAYSAYKFKFKDVPADYSEVYVYGDENLKERFKGDDGVPNLFVLKKDGYAENYGKIATRANIFVDLWNLKEWYAKEFVKSVEEHLNGILE